MSSADPQDTIVAIATAAGRGAVGIVRLSGPRARAIAGALCGSLPPPRVAALRHWRNAAGEAIDQGLVLCFEAPHSYSGEDVVELQGHGGPRVLQAAVEAACALGARRARPGEFSERAYLNGRLDLAQAEAVADLIDAGSQAAARAALRALDGELSRRVSALAEALLSLRVWVEGALDFSDEDIDWLGDAALHARLHAVEQDLAQLLAAAGRGRRLRDGLTVALTGRPNVGKSTLLNRLAGHEVAIVSDMPGTTRDLLREPLDLDGLPLTLVDTAGLRDSDDPLEREGVRRARAALAQAELALFVSEAPSGLTADDRALLAALPPALPVIVVLNKCDLADAAPAQRQSEGRTEITLCARSGAGLEELVQALHRHAGLGDAGSEGVISARARHLDALRRTQAALSAAAARLRERAAPELAAEDLRAAHAALGEITGQVSSEDLLGAIFSRFCIGK